MREKGKQWLKMHEQESTRVRGYFLVINLLLKVCMEGFDTFEVTRLVGN